MGSAVDSHCHTLVLSRKGRQLFFSCVSYMSTSLLLLGTTSVLCKCTFISHYSNSMKVVTLEFLNSLDKNICLWLFPDNIHLHTLYSCCCSFLALWSACLCFLTTSCIFLIPLILSLCFFPHLQPLFPSLNVLVMHVFTHFLDIMFWLPI